MPSGGSTAGEARRLTYVPALDGLRGFAVAAVLVYHGGFSWARGGFLGVSTFFTLSGFLITSLLLIDRDTVGQVRLGEFYRRRARRLLPASLLTLLLVLVYGAVVAGPTEREGLGADVLATLGQVANWRFVLGGRSYGDLFAAPSLLQHAWSLAIEEQFYLLFPPLVFLLVRRRWSLVGITRFVGGLLALSLVVTAVLSGAGASVDRLYFGTDTRAAELLVGALLALALARSPMALVAAGPKVATVGAVGLTATVVAWMLVEQSSSTLYGGGLLAYAVASTAVVAACLVPGPVSRLLSVAPLRRLGQISYGLYLFHWPVFRWLSPERLEVSRTTAFLLGTVVSVAFATLSFVLFETPIRERRSRPPASDRRRPPVAVPLPVVGALAAAVVIIGAVTVPSGGVEAIDIDARLAEFDELAAGVDAQPGAPVLGVFGDSSALATVEGLAQWANVTGRVAFGPGRTELGCGLIIDGEIRYGSEPGRPGDLCEDKTERYVEAGRELDLALVQFGPWDVADHKLPGDDEWRTIGDPVLDAALETEALRLIDLLTASGAVVLWVQPPIIRLGSIDGRPPTEPLPTSEPARMERFREMGERLAAARPDDVRLIDLAGFLRTQPGGELSPDLRPDGVHLTERASVYVSLEFLGDAIDEVWDELRDRRGS